jgi:hypothetical protein
MQEMANSLRMTVRAKALTEHNFDGEVALLTHLHSNAITLPDVEALVPSLRHNFKVMGKLATIGFFHSRGCINSQDLEQILIHVFTHDDHQNSLFQRTTAQIERVQREQADRYMSRLTEKQQHQRQQRDDILRQRHAEKEHRDAKHRRQTIPLMYRKISSQGFLPAGYSSIADVITEVDAMDWTQAQKIQKVNAAACENARTGRKKVKKIDVVPVQAKKAPVVTVDSFWAKTRLHNGPGLEDRRRPKVKLPQKDGDGRVVLMAAEHVIGEDEVLAEWIVGAVEGGNESLETALRLWFVVRHTEHAPLQAQLARYVLRSVINHFRLDVSFRFLPTSFSGMSTCASDGMQVS